MVEAASAPLHEKGSHYKVSWQRSKKDSANWNVLGTRKGSPFWSQQNARTGNTLFDCTAAFLLCSSSISYSEADTCCSKEWPFMEKGDVSPLIGVQINPKFNVKRLTLSPPNQSEVDVETVPACTTVDTVGSSKPKSMKRTHMGMGQKFTTRGPQVFIHVSIYLGCRFGSLFFTRSLTF